MAISGNLAEFSLPEIFQFLDRGSKSGLLKIRGLFDSQTIRYCYVWLDHGRVVATADRLDRQGLSTMIEQRGWFKKQGSSQAYPSCSLDMPLGLHLKSLGILQAEHLKMLFNMQVIRQICTIFHLSDGKFIFDPDAQTPKAEMTGLSFPASEATLMGLRGLRNWTILNEKLPTPGSTLFIPIPDQPKLRLEFQELQVYELANGKTPVRLIAEQLHLPIEKVQQIAFRLIVVGLIEEDPGYHSATNIPNGYEECFPEESFIYEPFPDPFENTIGVKDIPKREVVSTSFLQNLLGFLHKQV